jgi:hypothetical protein
MTARLTILSYLAVMASTAAAQETLPLTASDSDAVVRGAVRAALAIRADARPFWINRIEYDFTRGSSSGSWRFIAQRALYFADGVIDDPSRAPPPSCLNGRR